MATRQEQGVGTHYTRCHCTTLDQGRKDNCVLNLVFTDSCSEPCVAATGSDSSVRIFAADTMKCSFQTDPSFQENIISGLCFSHQSPAMLWASMGATVQCWDTRQKTTKPALSINTPGREQLTSLSLNCMDRMLVAGTVHLDDSISSLFFWDIRYPQTSLLAQFTDYHSDDITQVLFSEAEPHTLLTGSTDGLVCLLDVSSLEEEECLIAVMNTESSVSRLGFHGTHSEYIHCLSHTETFHVWSREEANPLSFIRETREKLQKHYGVTMDYLVECFYQTATHQLLVLSGDHSEVGLPLSSDRGGMWVIHAPGGEQLVPVSTLGEGHTSTVRCMSWARETGLLFTGAEDGCICVWKST